MEVPNYISSLLQPQAGKTSGRKVWSIDLETVWVPFFLATNTVNATAIPSDALGAPLRLAREDDGSVRFSKTGRPVVRVVKEVSEQVKIVRDNFVANLQSFTGQVMKKEKEGFAAQVEGAMVQRKHDVGPGVVGHLPGLLGRTVVADPGVVGADGHESKVCAPHGAKVLSDRGVARKEHAMPPGFEQIAVVTTPCVGPHASPPVVHA